MISDSLPVTCGTVLQDRYTKSRSIQVCCMQCSACSLSSVGSVLIGPAPGRGLSSQPAQPRMTWMNGDLENSQLPEVQVPLRVPLCDQSAFQTFIRRFKDPLSCSRSKSGIRNEKEHEPVGEELMGNHDSTSTFPQRTHPKLASATLFDKDLLFCSRKRQIPALCQHGRQKSRCKNAEVLPFVNTANLSNFARSVTVPHFAAILRGNGFAENAKGPRFVSMEGERQNARPAQIPQNLQVHTEPSDCRIHLSKFIFIIVHQALGQNSREKTLSFDASANGKAYVLRHMLLASAYSFAAGVSQQRCGTNTNNVDTPHEFQHIRGAHNH